jgi:hypothetical protein
LKEEHKDPPLENRGREPGRGETVKNTQDFALNSRTSYLHQVLKTEARESVVSKLCSQGEAFPTKLELRRTLSFHPLFSRLNS